MAKAGEDPQFFPLYILYCRQSTTETIPLVGKGDTDFTMADTQGTISLCIHTQNQQVHVQFLSPIKKQFLQNVNYLLPE